MSQSGVFSDFYFDNLTLAMLDSNENLHGVLFAMWKHLPKLQIVKSKHP